MPHPRDLCALPVAAQKTLPHFVEAFLLWIGRQAVWRLAATLLLAAIGLVCDLPTSAQTAHYSEGFTVLQGETQAGVNFGPVAVASAVPAQAILTFTFDSGGTIGAPLVTTQGDLKLDFTDSGKGSCNTNGTSHVYSAGDTCTVIALLTPRYSGSRYGAVTLLNSSKAVMSTAYLQGTGVGPQITYLPGKLKGIPVAINNTIGLALDSNSNLFVLTNASGTLDELLSAGGYGTVHKLLSGIDLVSGLALDGAGNVFISAQMDKVIELPAGSTSSSALAMQSAFVDLNGLAVDGGGDIFAADFYGSAVYEILASGGYETINNLGGGFPLPTAVAVDGSGNVFVLQYTLNTLKEIVAVNGVIPVSPSIVALADNFSSNPTSMAVDGNGNVYVAAGNVVQEFLAAGASKPPTPSTNR